MMPVPSANISPKTIDEETNVPKLTQVFTMSIVALLVAGCDQSGKAMSEAAANSGREVTHGEGAEGGHGRGLSNESAEMPEEVPPSSANTVAAENSN
jgi:hypothetical protein